MMMMTKAVEMYRMDQFLETTHDAAGSRASTDVTMNEAWRRDDITTDSEAVRSAEPRQPASLSTVLPPPFTAATRVVWTEKLAINGLTREHTEHLTSSLSGQENVRPPKCANDADR